MKSKLLSAYVQSLAASSISNLQLGGTQLGWMGDRSVPMTLAEGNWSAKSLLSRLYQHKWLALSTRCHVTYNAHIPVPVPTSRTLCRSLQSVILADRVNTICRSLLTCGFLAMGAWKSFPSKSRVNV